MTLSEGCTRAWRGHLRVRPFPAGVWLGGRGRVRTLGIYCSAEHLLYDNSPHEGDLDVLHPPETCFIDPRGAHWAGGFQQPIAAQWTGGGSLWPGKPRSDIYTSGPTPCLERHTILGRDLHALTKTVGPKSMIPTGEASVIHL
ncbi:hypothetical protein NDU88_005650 [Pleurodeles waltl]|uniref:Uncharacterized protein n=1 Tax=Pleurodeles waltl TaxID=8319 RepID=A0AAV7TX72_PLEWA|nr:hypothetical protein NDU88_005650 [Pleurodeles waltl]